MLRFLMVILFTLFSFNIARSTPPPPPGHGQSGDQEAPLGTGLGILAVLGLAYGAKKLYDARKDFNK